MSDYDTYKWHKYTNRLEPCSVIKQSIYHKEHTTIVTQDSVYDIVSTMLPIGLKVIVDASLVLCFDIIISKKSKKQ